MEGDRFLASAGILGHDPEWPVTFVRNEAEFTLELTFSWLSCPIFTSGASMPAKRSAIRKIKEVLRPNFEVKLSHEKIVAATGMPKGAVPRSLNGLRATRHRLITREAYMICSCSPDVVQSASSSVASRRRDQRALRQIVS
jgi:hypothetical protein